jgi:hypothetical protein
VSFRRSLNKKDLFPNYFEKVFPNNPSPHPKGPPSDLESGEDGIFGSIVFKIVCKHIPCLKHSGNQFFKKLNSLFCQTIRIQTGTQPLTCCQINDVAKNFWVLNFLENDSIAPRPSDHASLLQVNNADIVSIDIFEICRGQNAMW